MARGLFVTVCGLLSSCGVRIFSSLVVVPGYRAHGLCSLWHAGSLVEVHGLSSCAVWA